MKIVLMILLLIASIVLIASILFQSGNSAGLSGSIGGGAEQLGNLRQAFLVSLLGESEVLAVSLRFTSESVHQILVGLAHGSLL